MPDDPKPFDFGFGASPGGAWPAIMGDPGGEETGDAAVATGGAASRWNIVTKDSSELRGPTVAMSADSELQFFMGTGAKYGVRGALFFRSVGGNVFNYFRWTFNTVIGTPELHVMQLAKFTTNTDSTLLETPGTAVFAGVQSDLDYYGVATFEGWVTNSASATDLQLWWAPYDAETNECQLIQGSYIEYRRFS